MQRYTRRRSLKREGHDSDPGMAAATGGLLMAFVFGFIFAIIYMACYYFYKWCKTKRFFSQNFKQRIEHNSELPHSFAPNLESADASYDGETEVR